MDQNTTLPTITFSSEDLPEVKDWAVNGKYRLVIDVEEVGVRKAEGFDVPTADVSEGASVLDQKKVVVATFKITSVEVCDPKEPATSDYENEYADKMNLIRGIVG